MKNHTKSIIALASGTILLSGALCQTARAQSVILESGSSSLANAFGTSTGPEALNVSWFVLENTVSDVYTYGYVVNNPACDLGRNNNDTPTTTPELVNFFSVTFNTTVAGNYLSASGPVGSLIQNNGANGLSWAFSDVSPGSSSGLLSFQSDTPPTPGNASADGGSPPAPWSSIPSGQQVPVPDAPIAVHEPTSMALLFLTTSLFLAFRFTSAPRRGIQTSIPGRVNSFLSERFARFGRVFLRT
jgi:hypothetical protein